MSTTRHLLNRRRRLAAHQGGEDGAPPAEKATPGTTGATTTATAVRERGPAPRTTARTAGKAAAPGPKSPATRAGSKKTASADPATSADPADPDTADLDTGDTDTADTEPSPEGGDAPRRTPFRAAPRRALAVCAVVTLVFGGFAAWGASEAGALRDGSAARNTALADAGRTSEVKGEVTSAVNALFSYDHTSPAKNTRAAKRLLTGRAVKQHRALLAQVRAQGGKQRLVLTTTVTDSAVAALEGDRARVLLFADQHSARTGAAAQKKSKGAKGEKKDDATYAGAMLSVDAVREAGTWKIATIDTLN